MLLLRILVYPFAVLYGTVTNIRNLLFDLKILPTESFDLPLISVGNLSAGGTGKTPLVEYLIRLYKNQYKVATLSRGYKRATKGFRLVELEDHVKSTGDEALQFKKKFPDIIVAVDENRRRGIKTLLRLYPDLDIILLDDAFQHRYVKPGMSILLTDYHQLFTKDFLIPSGTLREPKRGYKRANILIVTKTGKVLSPLVEKELLKTIKPLPVQSIYYSYIRYGKLVSLVGEKMEKKRQKYDTILLICGIANPYPLQDHLRKSCRELITLSFKDHHQFTVKDIAKIRSEYERIISKNKIIITTEKDKIRLEDTTITRHLENLNICYIPIEVDFHLGGSPVFNNELLNYVESCKKSS